MHIQAPRAGLGRPTAPPRQGLYDPSFEHDACGVGFVVDIKGRKSHRILEQAIQVLRNLDHRGACGCEANTGDGAGMLLQMPHRFFQQACARAHIALPDSGHYGCGIVFLPREVSRRRRLEQRFEQIVQSEGQTLLGWRTVPTDNRSLGETARASEPFVRQVFIGRDPALTDDMAFERKLYVIRKRAYSEIRTSTLDGAAHWYLCSLSFKTIVYKGMLLHGAAGPLLPGPASTRPWRPRWRWCTRASPPTPSRAGTARIPTATSPTTARSTRCAATSTGCARARRCFESELFGEDMAKHPADRRTRTAATRRCSTTCSSCWCSPAARCRTRS